MAGPENNVQTHLARFQQNQPAAATPKLQLSKKRQVLKHSQNKGASLCCRLTFVVLDIHSLSRVELDSFKRSK